MIKKKIPFIKYIKKNKNIPLISSIPNSSNSLSSISSFNKNYISKNLSNIKLTPLIYLFYNSFYYLKKSNPKKTLSTSIKLPSYIPSSSLNTLPLNNLKHSKLNLISRFPKLTITSPSPSTKTTRPLFPKN